MPAMILCLFRFVRLLCSGHQSIVIENAALLLQLRAFQRTRRRPVLTASDRLFWCALAKVWSGWRGALMFVQPETVVRMATRAVPQILGSPVEANGDQEGAALHPGRDTPADCADGSGESALARAADSR